MKLTYAFILACALIYPTCLADRQAGVATNVNGNANLNGNIPQLPNDPTALWNIFQRYFLNEAFLRQLLNFFQNQTNSSCPGGASSQEGGPESEGANTPLTEGSDDQQEAGTDQQGGSNDQQGGSEGQQGNEGQSEGPSTDERHKSRSHPAARHLHKEVKKLLHARQHHADRHHEQAKQHASHHERQHASHHERQHASHHERQHASHHERQHAIHHERKHDAHHEKNHENHAH